MEDRLIELIQESVRGCSRYWASVIAEHLIANGVSFGRDPGYGWIPTSLGLPEGECLAVATIKGRPSYGEMIIGWVARDARSDSCYIAESDTEILMDVTYWMPLPKLPEEVTRD